MNEYKPHFRLDEFACKCCGEGGIKDETFHLIEAARVIADVPFVVTSGYRCEKKQGELVAAGRSKWTSSHPKGYAVDIYAANNKHRMDIIRGVLAAGFTRIWMGKNWIHVDNDPDKPAGLFGHYYE